MYEIWLLLSVCHTHSLLGAFCCSHRMRMLIFICIQASSLFTYHHVPSLSPKSVQETPIFILRRTTCCTDPDLQALSDTLCGSHVGNLASCRGVWVNLKEGIAFSVVANLSLSSRTVNEKLFFGTLFFPIYERVKNGCTCGCWKPSRKGLGFQDYSLLENKLMQICSIKKPI